MFFKKYEVIRSPGSENATLAPNIDRDTAKESQHTQLLLTTKELQSPIRRGYDYLEDYKKLETPVGELICPFKCSMIITPHISFLSKTDFSKIKNYHGPFIKNLRLLLKFLAVSRRSLIYSFKLDLLPPNST